MKQRSMDKEFSSKKKARCGLHATGNCVGVCTGIFQGEGSAKEQGERRLRRGRRRETTKSKEEAGPWETYLVC